MAYLCLSITFCIQELLILEFTDVTWNVTVLGSAFRVVPCGRHTPSVTFLLLKVSRSPSPLHKVIHECGEIIGMQRARSREREEA